MKCSLGILCEPLRSLGLHSHRSTAKRSSKRTSRKTTKTARTKKRR